VRKSLSLIFPFLFAALVASCGGTASPTAGSGKDEVAAARKPVLRWERKDQPETEA